MQKILVTGAAGFIGFHLCNRLIAKGDQVVGLDNLSDYYDVSLKKDRLAQLTGNDNFVFVKQNLVECQEIERLFAREKFEVVVNLAAQAGVRYSLINPYAYIDSNIVGFANILEGCRNTGVAHLVFASSSSVYGANGRMPFSVHDNVDHPVSLYAASKKANELMAHSYASLFDLPCTGLRFFTVYGPWGRPDMALFLFTKEILAGNPIDVFNYGKMQRDFTYIDDIIEGISRVIVNPPTANPEWDRQNPDPASSYAPYRIFNIGNNQPVELLHLIRVLEKVLGQKAQLKLLPIQPGDVPCTYADIDDLIAAVDFGPSTTIEQGVQKFVNWYRQYYRV